MISILDIMGVSERMSDEVYVMKRQQNNYHEIRYPMGTRFRMISGCGADGQIGYHVDSNWVTVCPDGVDVARFIGVKRDDLEVLKQ